MRFPQSIRKFILLVHILTSVGWIGAVAVFLALALTGLNNPMPQTARALYIAMDPITTCIIVPFAIASLTTGLIISLGTRWGLFRHYWVFFKFLINTLSLPILFLHISIIHRVAAAAKSSPFLPTDLHQDRLQLVAASAASLASLLIATFLSVYKPRGLTPFGS